MRGGLLALVRLKKEKKTTVNKINSAEMGSVLPYKICYRDWIWICVVGARENDLGVKRIHSNV